VFREEVGVFCCPSDEPTNEYHRYVGDFILNILQMD
jgi:hypothetical protein